MIASATTITQADIAAEKLAREIVRRLNIGGGAYDDKLELLSRAFLAQRERAEKAISPIPARYACQLCGRRDGLDAVVPNYIWARLSGAANGANILCLWCMDELALVLELADTSVALHFAGRRLHGSSDVRFAECIGIATRSAVTRAEKAEDERDKLRELVKRAARMFGRGAPLELKVPWLADAKKEGIETLDEPKPL